MFGTSLDIDLNKPTEKYECYKKGNLYTDWTFHGMKNYFIFFRCDNAVM